MNETVIKYEANLALEWKRLDTPPDNDHIMIATENNLECLRQALLLDELSHTSHEDASIESRDLSRLEKKIDLLLSLVGSVVQKQQRAGPNVHVTLGAGSITWKSDELAGLVKNDLLLLQLFLNKFSVFPMTLYCQVTDIQGDACVATLCYLDEMQQELLEKYIFLNHRRMVAAKRKPGR